MATHEAKPTPPTNGCGHDLEGFLRGELPRDAMRALVRHLLTGCPGCREVGRRAWELSEGEEPYMEQINAAREQLREIAGDLETIRFRLLGVQASLPEPAADGAAPGLMDDLEAMDLCTEIRAVIGCVLTDCVAAAIGDLRDAAALPAGPSERESVKPSGDDRG
jgi:hypothetical protein